MPESLPDFRAVLAALEANRVRYVLIGGVAMVPHGCDYQTEDIDLGYARDHQNLRGLAQALGLVHPRLRGFPPDLPFRWDERTLSAAFSSYGHPSDYAPLLLKQQKG